MITTKELRDIVAQAYNGLITDAELLLKLQLPPHVVPHVITWSKLPLAAFDKIDLGDLFDVDDPRNAPISAFGSEFASVLDATVVKDWLRNIATCLAEYTGCACDSFTLRIMHYEYALSNAPKHFYVFDFGTPEANTLFLSAMKSALSSDYTQDELREVVRSYDGYDADAKPFVGIMIMGMALYNLDLHVPKPLVKTPLRTLVYESVSPTVDENSINTPPRKVPRVRSIKREAQKPRTLVANLPNKLVAKRDPATRDKRDKPINGKKDK